MITKIYSVDSVELAILKTNPLTLRIVASGSVNSTGWNNPQLLPYIYIAPPQDGIYDFDMVADKPDGFVHWTITPISAVTQWQPFPDSLRGVRVHSSSGNVVKMLDCEKCGDEGGSPGKVAAANEARVPVFLTGLVIEGRGPAWCRDAVTHRLVGMDGTGREIITRLSAMNDDVSSVLAQVAGSRQRVMIAGYFSRGIEPGCDYVNCFYAGSERSPDDFASRMK
jgi:hypothetical protein